MKHELVHRLTHVGHRRFPATLPDRGHLARVGELARAALRGAGLIALLAAMTLAAQLAAIAATTGLFGHPLAVLVGAMVATAATPSLAARLAIRLAGRT